MRSGGTAEAPLRVGIINLMPRAQHYEPSLLGPLREAGRGIEPCWIRLDSHAYASSDRRHMAARYRPFRDVIAAGPLDGLVLSGAPVEELEFEDITYWPELAEILSTARERVSSTLGLCWGGLALAKLLGISKQALPLKLFGVFPLDNLAPDHVLLRRSAASFLCPQSRHSGIADAELERAVVAGHVRPLAQSRATGPVIFESSDRRFVAHLGHPEYEPERLVLEYERDRAQGRSDVPAPYGIDLTQPSLTWRAHREQFFAGWLELLQQRR